MLENEREPAASEQEIIDLIGLGPDSDAIGPLDEQQMGSLSRMIRDGARVRLRHLPPDQVEELKSQLVDKQWVKVGDVRHIRISERCWIVDLLDGRPPSGSWPGRGH